MISYYTAKKRLFICDEIERNDPDLIKVVELLGEDVNERFSKLKIVEIPDDVDWEINSNDMEEWVEEKHDRWN